MGHCRGAGDGCGGRRSAESDQRLGAPHRSDLPGGGGARVLAVVPGGPRRELRPGPSTSASAPPATVTAVSCSLWAWMSASRTPTALTSTSTSHGCHSSGGGGGRGPRARGICSRQRAGADRVLQRLDAPPGIFHAFGAFLQKSGPATGLESLRLPDVSSPGPSRRRISTGSVRWFPTSSGHWRSTPTPGRGNAGRCRGGGAGPDLRRRDPARRAGSCDRHQPDRRPDPGHERRAHPRSGRSLGLDFEADRRAPSARSPGRRRRARAGGGCGRGLRLARPSGRPALEVVVTPIRRESSPLFDRRAAAAIFVADPDAELDRPPERLRRLYGFTPVEAEVASRMVEGMRSRRDQRRPRHHHPHGSRSPEAALRQDGHPPADRSDSGAANRPGRLRLE